jgi:hypothetical protein
MFLWQRLCRYLSSEMIFLQSCRIVPTLQTTVLLPHLTALKIELAGSSERSLNFYRTPHCHIPQHRAFNINTNYVHTS